MFTKTQLETLTDKIYSCKVMQGPARDSVVWILNYYLGSSVRRNNAATSTSLHDTIEIIKSCHDHYHYHENGLEHLLYCINWFEYISDPCIEAYIYYDSVILSSIIKNDGAIQSEDLCYCHSLCAPDLLATSQAIDTATIVENLYRLHRGNMEQLLRPLICFVLLLLQLPNAQGIHAGMEDWLNNVVKYRGIDQKYVNEQREHAFQQYRSRVYNSASEGEQAHPAENLRSPSLLISLESCGQARFSVTAWLCRYEVCQTRPNCNELLSSIEEGHIYTISSDSVTVDLSALITRFFNYKIIKEDLSNKEYKSMIIEISLPIDMLCDTSKGGLFPAEDIQLGSGEDALPLRLLHPIVVRLSERKHMSDRYWKIKWDKFLGPTKPSGVSLYWPSSIGSCTTGALQSALAPENIVGLGLSYSPSSFSTPEVVSGGFRSIINAIRSLGIPVALWLSKLPEDAPDEESLQKRMQDYIDEHDISKLPKNILKARREAHRSSDPNHLGHYIRLLYDDPYKLPDTMLEDRE